MTAGIHSRILCEVCRALIYIKCKLNLGRENQTVSNSTKRYVRKKKKKASAAAIVATALILENGAFFRPPQLIYEGVSGQNSWCINNSGEC